MGSRDGSATDKGEPIYRLPHIRLDPVGDRDLIGWLQKLDQMPLGVKGQTYKEILRQGLRVVGELPSDAPPERPATPTGSPLDSSLDAATLLGDIRRVVEAAVESGMARRGLVEQGDNQAKQESEPVGDDTFLDTLMGDLLLGDDD